MYENQPEYSNTESVAERLPESSRPWVSLHNDASRSGPRIHDFFAKVELKPERRKAGDTSFSSCAQTSTLSAIRSHGSHQTTKKKTISPKDFWPESSHNRHRVPRRIPNEDGRYSSNRRFETSQAAQDPRKKLKGRTWRPLKRAWELVCLNGRNWVKLEGQAKR